LYRDDIRNSKYCYFAILLFPIEYPQKCREKDLK
jgi:hypothetical protein